MHQHLLHSLRTSSGLHCLHFRPLNGTWLLISLRMCSWSIGCWTFRIRFKTAWKCNQRSHLGKSIRRTELLYCTSMRMRFERCLDNFCMTLVKLIDEKKLRQVNSVNISTSSSLLNPFGSTVVRVTVRLGWLSIWSSVWDNWGFFEQRRRQYRKKLKGRQ